MKHLILTALLAASLSASSALAATWNKLIGPDDLSALIRGGDVTVLDIRDHKAYAGGHVAGALSAPYGSWRGPKQNPGARLSDAQLTERLQSLGLEPGDRVVVTYQGANTTDFGAAARVYWTLKSAGLTEIAILNGGVVSWVKAGKGLSQSPVIAERSDASFTLAEDWMITREGVQDVLTGARQSTMIDARPLVFWKGDKKHPAAKRAGTLEGALQITHDSWFPGSTTEVTAADRVMEIAREAGYAEDSKELVSFCNTGHWAATNWFALSELAGVEGVKLYPESMVGWANSGGALMNEK
ncbi:MAG: rhodanese-like domain-containing protein [Paracoccaceae bacterium]|nr:rhodanese-like domain-containing protein [Paracoccaceae bacterium]